MANSFSVIVEDFDEALTSLGLLVQIGQGRAVPAKTRVASIHATTLMLAAAFEEFIREMAHENAVQVVNRAYGISALPDTLPATAWKRTLSDLARIQRNGRSTIETLRMLAKQARPKIDALCSFVEGDIGQNIYDHLIYNESNMRAREINRMFKISGLREVCLRVCEQASLKEFFDHDDVAQTHGDLLRALDMFINRRNEIAHSLNSAISSAPQEVFRVIEMFRAFAKDLEATLETELA